MCFYEPLYVHWHYNMVSNKLSSSLQKGSSNTSSRQIPDQVFLVCGLLNTLVSGLSALRECYFKSVSSNVDFLRYTGWHNMQTYKLFTNHQCISEIKTHSQVNQDVFNLFHDNELRRVVRSLDEKLVQLMVIFWTHMTELMSRDPESGKATLGGNNERHNWHAEGKWESILCLNWARGYPTHTNRTEPMQRIFTSMICCKHGLFGRFVIWWKVARVWYEYF